MDKKINYILGIGNLSTEECDEVIFSLNSRLGKMKESVKTLQNEVNHLETIHFQVSQRKKEIETKFSKENSGQ